MAGLVALAACAKPVTAPSAATAAAPRVWSYEVVANGGDLDVSATFPAGTAATFSLEAEATPFVADVATSTVNKASIVPDDGIWTIPECAAGCAVHYRFHLDAAARALDDMDSAVSTRGCIEAPPSAWLLRPTEHAAGTRYRFHVRAAAGSRFASGVHPVANAPDTYAADASDLDTAPYSVFGPFRTRTLARADATIELAILPGHLDLDDAAIDHWVDISARAIEAYYGRFPVPRFLLLVAPHGHRRNETVEGRTLSSGGSSILLGVSGGMTADEIPRDWVLPHEMTHLALPTLRRDEHWLEEGLATYVEPLARAKVGTIRAEEVWRGLIDGLPNGEPDQGDEGLDRTHTWGRTYWGGALFSFVADLEIRRRTGNKRSLEDALRGILAAGGTGEARWSLEEALRKGDEAAGAPVLEEMHAKWGTTPVTVDLPQIWAELGVREEGDGRSIVFDERAPLAETRRAMTARESPDASP
ncbi:MAG: hypothetical protein ACLQVI_34830 [Polyangiaceae bacterium]